MKIPKFTSGRWERLLERYVNSVGISTFHYDNYAKRFTGVKGFAFTRVTPRMEGGWVRLPEYFKRYEKERRNGNPHPVVMFIASKDNGLSIEDSFVLIRLEHFVPLLATCIESDPQRYLGKD